MNDLVARLKEHFETSCGDAHATCGEAADEIERLRAGLYEVINSCDDYLDAPAQVAKRILNQQIAADEPSEVTVRKMRDEWPDRQ